MKRIIMAFLVIFLISKVASASSIEILPKLEKSVVAIGYMRYELNGITGQIENKFILLGTGVLLKTDRYILVTAKHVILDEAGMVDPNLCFWGNKIGGGPSIRFFLKQQEKWPCIKWVPHSDPGIDLVAIIVGLDLSTDDISFVTLEDFKKIVDVSKGEDVYYLGFPMGYGAYGGSDPMVRKGMVALKEKNKKYFYIDATVAPGNSGGPVFTLGNKEGKFIGIVTAFPFFQKEGEIFHSGLGIVYPVDYIEDILNSPSFKKTY